MAEIKGNDINNGIGQIQIADEVIATIAGTAAMEIDGVVAATGNIADIAELLGKKNLSKGVKVDVDGNDVEVELNLYVRNGFKIQDVCTEVQKRVKTAIETMTGLNAPVININVNGIVMDKEKASGKKDFSNMDND